MTEPNGLRERLLALDGAREPSTETRKRYESEVRAMFDQTLSTRGRIGYALCAVVCGGFALLMLSAVLGKPDPELPWIVQMIAWFAMAGFGGIALINAFAAIRGRWRRRTHSQLLILIAGVMLAGMGTAFLRVGAEGDPVYNNVMLQTTGWILLGLLAVSVLMHYMEEQQFKTQAKLLELELRLAQIAERLEKR